VSCVAGAPCVSGVSPLLSVSELVIDKHSVYQVSAV
jgi:hypothetical protein